MTIKEPIFKNRIDILRFTLIELLVVITIIAILAAILLPVLANARAKAKEIVCLNQQKQWGAAHFIWAEDHEGYFISQDDKEAPSNGYPEVSGADNPLWYWNLYRYGINPGAPFSDSAYTVIKSFEHPMLLCPAENLNGANHLRLGWHGGYRKDMTLLDQDSGAWPTQNRDAFAYLACKRPVRDRFGLAWKLMPYKLIDFYDPSNQLLQTEKQFQYHSRPGRCGALGGGGIANGLGYTVLGARHMQKATCVFLDGHVESIKLSILADVTDPFHYWRNPNDKPPRFTDPNDY